MEHKQAIQLESHIGVHPVQYEAMEAGHSHEHIQIAETVSDCICVLGLCGAWHGNYQYRANTSDARQVSSVIP